MTYINYINDRKKLGFECVIDCTVGENLTSRTTPVFIAILIGVEVIFIPISTIDDSKFFLNQNNNEISIVQKNNIPANWLELKGGGDSTHSNPNQNQKNENLLKSVKDKSFPYVTIEYTHQVDVLREFKRLD